MDDVRVIAAARALQVIESSERGDYPLAEFMGDAATVLEAADAVDPLRNQRIIETAEELRALPIDSVLRDDGGRIWEVMEVGYGGVDKSLRAMGVGSMLACSSFRQFPATVLSEPHP